MGYGLGEVSGVWLGRGERGLVGGEVSGVWLARGEQCWR